MLKVAASLLLGLLLVPVGDTATGAYVITLKNGNEFVTARYWQEGRQILFDAYGGVFGVDKAFVTKIDASDKPPTPLATITREPELRQQPRSGDAEPEPKPPPDATPKKSEVNRADDPIFKEFDALKEKFKGLDGMLTSELQDFSDEVTRLKRRIQSSKTPNDYFREFTAAVEMGGALEEALNSRR